MSYTQDEVRTFKLFIEKANKLWSSRFISDVKNLSLTLGYKQNEGTTSKINLPPEEIIESLLMRYRHFYMEKSPIKLEKILNIIYKNSDKKTQGKVSEIRKTYLDTLNKSPISIKLDEKVVTPKEIINSWLYGEHFHLDERRREIIRRMQNMTPGLSVFLLLILFHRIIACIKITSEIIEKQLLNENSDGQ